LPDQEANAARLLQNRTDLGNALKAQGGEEAGNQLTALLKTHIQGAVDILAAAQTGDKAKQDAATAPGEVTPVLTMSAACFRCVREAYEFCGVPRTLDLRRGLLLSFCGI